MATTAIVDIYDAELYVAGTPHALFAELRRTSPVFWREGAQGPGYWAGYCQSNR